MPLSTNTATCSNRLLVPAEDHPVFAECPIPIYIDPTHEMRTNANACGLVYTEDNAVEYMQIVDGRPYAE